ncbi:MAG: SCP2 sterol-binding domain-containing protein [Actinobacteria bacterium]|nr:SCP2 sterol-binding domain-containing protein [Actinomycetota bacterium]
MTVKFLSPEWALQVQRAMNDSERFKQAATGHSAVLQQVVTGTPDGGEARYYLKLRDGRAEVGLGELPDSEAIITQSYATAAAINRRELKVQNAFMQGQLQVRGNLMKLLSLAGVVGAMVEAIDTIHVDY